MGTDVSKVVIQRGQTEDYTCLVPKAGLPITPGTAAVSSGKVCKADSRSCAETAALTIQAGVTGWGRAKAETEDPLLSRGGQILVHLLTSQLVMVSEPMNQYSIPGGDTGQAANNQLSHLG